MYVKSTMGGDVLAGLTCPLTVAEWNLVAA